MGRAMRGAGSRTIVAVKAGAKNGAKDARRSRALCTRCVLAEKAGARHETGAAADSDCLARLMSGLRLCTLRCGGRAQVLSHHARRDTRGLQRCTRVDLNATGHIPSDPGHPGVEHDTTREEQCSPYTLRQRPIFSLIGFGPGATISTQANPNEGKWYTKQWTATVQRARHSPWQ